MMKFKIQSLAIKVTPEKKMRIMEEVGGKREQGKKYRERLGSRGKQLRG
jgi:hypothetical protein